MSAEPVALQEHGGRAQHQMQVFGMRNQRQKDQQRQRMRPPHRLSAMCYLRTTTALPRYVTIRMKISRAITPDSAEILPSHTGRAKKRRINKPAMETATSTAQTETNA